MINFDHHEGAINIAIADAKAAGVDRLIRFTCQNADTLLIDNRKENVRFVITNPPWNNRLSVRSILQSTL